MDDLISRQAAIDALEKSRFPGALYIDTGVQIAMREIEALPSAQPEIIRCRDCKWNIGDECCFEQYAYGEFDDDGFCSFAEMKGGE